jgi:benzoyl-CoA reductase/2-hydroxyglutaryl-CoA dehydratase subunit BcrC/BadD/HgdB
MDTSHLYVPVIKNILRQERRTIECVETGEPFLATQFTTPVEIMTAMDLHWYFHIERAMTPGITDTQILDDLDGAETMGLPSDICPVGRLTLYYLHIGVFPRPTAYIAEIHPCDAVSSMHSAYLQHPEWRDVPMFAPDAPYHLDEHSLGYYADELRRAADFITTHTGKTLDMNRLKQAIEETNKGVLLFQEYSELRRSVPTPHGSTLPRTCYGMLLTEGAGNPENGQTRWFEEMVEDAEMRVRENKPEIPNQKIRVLWFDFLPVYVNELIPWMEQEWGAVIVMEMAAYCPFELIDTSTEDSMFRGLAERSLQHPVMVRQSHSTVDTTLEDVTRIVKDYKMDCVIFPGHMGHKDQHAYANLLSEVCRDLEVPFLNIGINNFDKRYTTVYEIKEKISRFFVGMGLG